MSRLRLLVSLLVGAQAGALAGLPVCDHGEDDRFACERVSESASEDALSAPISCNACGMDDCDDMIACTVVTPALVRQPLPILVPVMARLTTNAPAASVRSVPPPPLSPPPRA